MSAYTVYFRGERVLRFHMDATEADGTIYIEGEDGEMDVTVFQTADAAHDPEIAADVLNGWLESEGGAAWPAGARVDVEPDDEDEGEEA